MRRPEQRVDILARQPQRPPARAFEQRVGQALLARLHALDGGLDGILGDQTVNEYRLVLANPVRPVPRPRFACSCLFVRIAAGAC